MPPHVKKAFPAKVLKLEHHKINWDISFLWQGWTERRDEEEMERTALITSGGLETTPVSAGTHLGE